MPRGTPQIEITYDVDANGILNVNEEKSSGKSENITVTNDKGRLTKEDIKKMVEEAEKFKEDDLILKEKIEAKNSFESYYYSIKQGVEKDDVKDKLDENELESVNNKLEELKIYLDDNESYTKEDFEEKKTELEEVCKPFSEKILGSNSMPDMNNMDPNMMAEMMKNMGGGGDKMDPNMMAEFC